MHQIERQPDHLSQEHFGQPVLADDAGGLGPTGFGELNVAVVGHVQQPVAFHALHGLAHRRTALAQTLSDAGTKGRHTLLFQVVDRVNTSLSYR